MFRAIGLIATCVAALGAVVLFAYAMAARGGLYETADVTEDEWVVVPAAAVFVGALIAATGLVVRSIRVARVGFIVQATGALVSLVLTDAAEVSIDVSAVVGGAALLVSVAMLAWSLSDGERAHQHRGRRNRV